MCTINPKPLDIDITKIQIEQMFGYINTYQRIESIKHKKKKINDKWYDTRKSDLIYYNKDYKHCNDFNLIFVYRTVDGEYFRRSFISMGETFELISKSAVLIYLNKGKSLF